jgi:glycosyltransferase involved in cell wall biosynthesis
VHRRRLVLFGQPASMHRATMLAFGRWLVSAAPDVSLTWLGRSTDEMRESWEGAWRLPTERIIFAGGLPAAGVSAALQSAHVGLAPYENGASGRRGSFAALMEHGLPVVAVDGLYTSDWLRESGACVWTPESDPPAFVNALSQLVDDAGAREALSARARAMFDARLAWPVIGRAFARLLSEGVSA